MDFAEDAEGARLGINDWVEQGTGCLIPELLPSGALDASTQVVLVDALSVAADWVDEFPDEVDRTFTLADGSEIQATTLVGSTTVLRSSVAGAEVITLPTKDPTLSLRIVLPEEGVTTADELLTGMDGADLQSWMAAGTSEYVSLRLPLLDLATSVDLVDHFADLGLASLPGNPAWGSLCPTCSAVGAAKQQVVVQVGARGLRAAAATYASGVSSAPPELDVNRPFLFLVTDEAAGVPWFVGIVRDPRDP